MQGEDGFHKGIVRQGMDVGDESLGGGNQSLWGRVFILVRRVAIHVAILYYKGGGEYHWSFGKMTMSKCILLQMPVDLFFFKVSTSTQKKLEARRCWACRQTCRRVWVCSQCCCSCCWAARRGRRRPSPSLSSLMRHRTHEMVMAMARVMVVSESSSLSWGVRAYRKCL
jgi:hypothetical protein